MLIKWYGHILYIYLFIIYELIYFFFILHMGHLFSSCLLALQYFLPKSINWQCNNLHLFLGKIFIKSSDTFLFVLFLLNPHLFANLIQWVSTGNTLSFVVTNKKTFADIIIRPILTEKGNLLSETQNKYVFQVAKNANKVEIKKSIEKTKLIRPDLLEKEDKEQE